MPQKTGEVIETAAGRAARLAKQKPDTVEGLQKYAIEERKRQEEEKKKKKASEQAGVNTAPSKGILGRIYDSVMGTPTEKK